MSFINNIGNALTNSDLIGGFTDEAEDQFALIRDSYAVSDNPPKAVIEGPGGNGTTAPGAYSLFNPFNIFRYSKLGLSTNEGGYDVEKHLDNGGAGDQNAQNAVGLVGGLVNFVTGSNVGDQVSQLAQKFNEFSEIRKEVENPTASEIISWALRQGREGSTTQSPVPYTPSDFLWCKYYGKVPNNRMVTLRRYPFPIEDNIKVRPDLVPVPIAQAVTWYGKDVDNNLNSILNLSWGLNWKKLPATDIQDLNGNEIKLDTLLDEAKISDPKVRAAVKAIMVTNGGDSVDMAKLTGYDSALNDYIKNAYGANGPYWNRILGPVNVVNETYIRDRGMAWQQDIILNFEYSLRSYGGVNPKIAFLDLLTNFLSLTYNTASFWGGGIRYFEEVGVTIDALGMENDILGGDVEAAIINGLTAISKQGAANLNTIIREAEAIVAKGETVTTEDRDKIAGELNKGEADNKSGVVGRFFSQKLGKLMRLPLSFRSILDGRAIGEWHVVIGNPMNPLAMIGNLMCKGVKMEVGETLGVDDFPTEFKFIVTLGHGRPRAKQDIESIFNMGNGKMSFSQLSDPSSARNSYGEYNTAKADSVYATEDKGSGSKVNDAQQPLASSTNDAAVQQYSRRVRNLYGSGYGNSKILTSYFTDVKTKD